MKISVLSLFMLCLGIVVSSQLFCENFKTLGAIVIDDAEYDETEFIKGGFVIANENAPYLFAPSYPQEEGRLALISVGSFRTLIGFTSGSFSHLIQADIDSGMVEFNRLHLGMIKALGVLYPDDIKRQRLQYVALMHGKWLSQNEYQNALNCMKSIPKSIEQRPCIDREIAQKLMRLQDSLFDKDQKPQLENIFKVMDQSEEILREEGARDAIADLISSPYISSFLMVAKYGVQGINYYWEYDFADFFPTGGFRGLFDYNSTNIDNFSYYWESDEKWEKIQTAITGNKIAIVRASVTDIDKLAEIGDALRSGNIDVANVDISNIPEYLDDSKKNNLIDALDTLPLSPQAKVNIVAIGYRLVGEPGRKMVIVSEHDNFRYLSVPIHDEENSFKLSLETYGQW